MTSENIETLAEFLLARLAEDEAAVGGVAFDGWHTVECGVGLGYWATGECVCGYPARVLAEVQAKRRIVARHRACEPHYDEGNRLETRVLDWTMRLLALPYAEHSDYREEWKP